MLHVMESPSLENQREIYSRLREMIGNEIDLLNTACRFGVAASTLRKIREGGPISRFIVNKIGRASEGGKHNASASKKKSTIERLLFVYYLYQRKGSLKAVGEEIGISRERVRQLLRKGMEVGLFKYKPSDRAPAKISVSKEKILDDYERLLTLKAVAHENDIPPHRLHQLLKFHQITGRDFEKRRSAARKRFCLERYDAAVDSLGHHPTTTELQQFSATRYLYMQIRKLWGSIDAFRKECGAKVV